MISEAVPGPTLADALARIPDPRREHLRVHGLVAILQVAIAAMLCGARTTHAVAQWTRERFEDSPQLLEALGVVPGHFPSGPTFHRVFRRVVAALFEAVLGEWLQGRLQPNETIGIDGKTVRGTLGKEVPGLHLVSAYAVHGKAVVLQMACAGKGLELQTAKELVERLPLEGDLVVADALLCQREICQKIGDSGGDYLIPVKENQPSLRAEIERAFSPSGA